MLKFRSEAFEIALSTKDVTKDISAFMPKQKPEFREK